MPAPPRAPTSTPRDRTRRSAAVDALLTGAAAALLRLPALLATRHHHPDDGTYGASAIAMRDGGVPFRDVFSSQGPLHLPLVWLFDFPRTAWSPRLSSAVAGAALTVVVYAVARRLTDRNGAIIAAIVVATSGSALWTAGPITSDAPTALFVALAALAALRYDAHPGTARAVGFGLCAAAAVSCKPALGIVGALPATWIVARRRRGRDVLAAAGAAMVFGLVLVVPFGVADVWDQAIRYQLDSEREQSVLANARKVLSTAWEREVPLLAGLAVAAAVSVARRPTVRRASGSDPWRRVLGAWVAVVALFLVLQPALWRNHLMALVTPLALLVATARVPRRWIVAALVVAAPLHVVHVRDVLDPPPYDTPTAAAVAALRALPEDAQALSDEVGIVWRAGRRTPGDFVDASIKQLQQGRIDAARIAAAAARPEVCAVLVWRSTHWGALDDLPGRLADAGYAVDQRFSGSGGARVLYSKRDCAV